MLRRGSGAKIFSKFIERKSGTVKTTTDNFHTKKNGRTDGRVCMYKEVCGVADGLRTLVVVCFSGSLSCVRASKSYAARSKKLVRRERSARQYNISAEQCCPFMLLWSMVQCSNC